MQREAETLLDLYDLGEPEPQELIIPRQPRGRYPYVDLYHDRETTVRSRGAAGRDGAGQSSQTESLNSAAEIEEEGRTVEESRVAQKTKKGQLASSFSMGSDYPFTPADVRQADLREVTRRLAQWKQETGYRLDPTEVKVLALAPAKVALTGVSVTGLSYFASKAYFPGMTKRNHLLVGVAAGYLAAQIFAPFARRAPYYSLVTLKSPFGVKLRQILYELKQEKKAARKY